MIQSLLRQQSKIITITFVISTLLPFCLNCFHKQVQNNPGAAESCFIEYNSALEFDKHVAAIYKVFATAFEVLELRSNAIDCLTKAISLDSDNISYYNERAKIYEKLGKNDLAKTDKEIIELLTYGPPKTYYYAPW